MECFNMSKNKLNFQIIFFIFAFFLVVFFLPDLVFASQVLSAEDFALATGSSLVPDENVDDQSKNLIKLTSTGVGNGQSSHFSANGTQEISYNANSLVTADNTEVSSKNFNLTQEGENDWELIGGEQNSPLAFWVDGDNSYDEIKNNSDNFSKSRVFYYVMICESVKCEVINKPSYINILNTKQDGKKCFYELEFDSNAPSGQEFTIEFNKEAECKFEVKDREEFITYRVVQRKEENYKTDTLYNFKAVYTGMVPVISSQSLAVSNDVGSGNVVKTNNLLLESLFVDGHQLTPSFIPNYSYYQVDLNSGLNSSPLITAVAFDINNSISINKPIDIKSDAQKESTAYINVISPDNKSRKTYVVVFNQKKEKNYLTKLSSTMGNLEPVFNKYVSNYQVDLIKKKELLIDNIGVQAILKSIIVESENLTDQITLTPVQFESDDFLTVLIDLKSIDGLKFNQYYLTFYANERMWHY